jgi:Fungal specific transcription factor domain
VTRHTLPAKVCGRTSICVLVQELTRLIYPGCRKASRECVYPEKKTSSKTARSRSRPGKASATARESSSDPDDGSDNGGAERFEGHLNDVSRHFDTGSAADAGSSGAKNHGLWDTSNSDNRRRVVEGSGSDASYIGEASASPSENSSSVSNTLSAHSTSSFHRPSRFPQAHPHSPIRAFIDFSAIPAEQRKLINYHRDVLTHHHYQFKHRAVNFLQNTLLQMAVEYPPLLYAVLAFSAYHYTITVTPDGKIDAFLGYYNKSVELLRRDLMNTKGKHRVETLVAIIQLASFEVSDCVPFAHWEALVTVYLGVPRGLGEPNVPSKSCLRNIDRAF